MLGYREYVFFIRDDVSAVEDCVKIVAQLANYDRLVLQLASHARMYGHSYYFSDFLGNFVSW